MATVIIEWLKESPLEKVKGETKKSNAALGDYARMGVGRSQRALVTAYRERRLSDSLVKPPTVSLGTIENWSMKFDWVKRIIAWEEIEAEDLKELWKERRIKIMETDYLQGVALRDTADMIIEEAPSYLKTTRRILQGKPTVVDQNGKIIEQGEPTREIIRTALDYGIAIRASKIGSDLSRRAVGMNTEQTAINIGISDRESQTGVPFEDADPGKVAEFLKDASDLSGRIADRILSESEEGIPSGVENAETEEEIDT